MKKFNVVVIIIVLCITIFSACEKTEIDAVNAYDVFYLRNKNADMPVHVKGNTASKTFILWLHGGPGDSSIPEKYGNQEINKKLENNYAMVYWDQRCAGTSTGKFNPEDLTIDLMVNDLEKLVTLIKHRYGHDISLYLLGHSWGGALGYSYLSKPENQDQVKGFINVSGPHNTLLRIEQQRETYIDLAKRQISCGNNKINWQKGIDKFANLNLSDKDNWGELAPEIPDALSYLEEIDSLINKEMSFMNAKAVFRTPDVEMALMNFFKTKSSPIIEELKNLDISKNLQNIHLPILFCSGYYDLTVTQSQLQTAFDLVKSNIKTHKVFYHSAHNLYTSEPETFYNAVTEFVNSTN